MKTNLEIVHDLYKAFREKDYDAFIALCARDLEWVQNEGFPRGATWHGPQAVVDGVFRTFDDTWEDWKYEVERYLDAGNSIVVVGRYRGRHRLTGKTFNSPAAHIYDLIGGRVQRFRQFTDTKVIWDAME